MAKRNGKHTKSAPTKGTRALREFSVVIERDDDGWYVASVPELRGCHTQAKSLDLLLTRTREAILLCLDVAGDNGRSEFIGVQRVAV